MKWQSLEHITHARSVQLHVEFFVNASKEHTMAYRAKNHSPKAAARRALRRRK